MRKISLIVGLFMVLALLVSFGYAKSMDHNNKITAIQKKSNKSAVGIKENAINGDTDQSGVTASMPTDQVELPFTAAPYTDRLEDLRNAQSANSGTSNSYTGYVNPLLPAATFYIDPNFAPETNQSGSRGGNRVQPALVVNPDMETNDIVPADEAPENIVDQTAVIDTSEPNDKNDKQKDRKKPDNDDKQKDRGKSDNNDGKQKDRDKPDNDGKQKDRDKPDNDDKQKDKDKRDNSDKQKDRNNPGSNDKKKDKN